MYLTFSIYFNFIQSPSLVFLLRCVLFSVSLTSSALLLSISSKINFSSHCPFLFFSCSFFHFLLKSVFLSVPSSLPPRFFRRQSLPCTKWCDGCNWLTSASNRITAGTQIALVITRNPPPFRSGANTVKQKKTDWREREWRWPRPVLISVWGITNKSRSLSGSVSDYHRADGTRTWRGRTMRKSFFVFKTLAVTYRSSPTLLTLAFFFCSHSHHFRSTKRKEADEISGPLSNWLKIARASLTLHRPTDLSKGSRLMWSFISSN